MRGKSRKADKSAFLLFYSIYVLEIVFLPDLFQRFLIPGAYMPLHSIPHFRHNRQIGFLRDVPDSDDANLHMRSSPFTFFRSFKRLGDCQHFFDRFHNQSVVLQMIQTGNADGTSHFFVLYDRETPAADGVFFAALPLFVFRYFIHKKEGIERTVPAVQYSLFLPVQPRTLFSAVHQIMQDQPSIVNDPYADWLRSLFLDFVYDAQCDFQAHIMRKCFKLQRLFLFQNLNFVHYAFTFP